MKTTHFMAIQRPDARILYGVLYTQTGSALQTVDALLSRAVDLGLLPHTQVRSLWSRLWRCAPADNAPYDSLTEIATALDAYAAPGYEFAPSFLDGRTVWGWFPRQG